MYAVYFQNNFAKLEGEIKRGVEEIFSEMEEEHVPFYVGKCKFGDRGRYVLVVKKL